MLLYMSKVNSSTVLLHNADFKYVVVKSDYTARLVNTFKFVLYKNTDNSFIETDQGYDKSTRIYRIDECYTCGAGQKEKCDCPPIVDVLFIYDKTWGKGFYAAPGLDIEKYINDIDLLINNCEDGFIVFHNTVDNCYVNIVKEYEYCHMMAEFVEAKVVMHNNQPFAMIYDVSSGCESG